MQVDESTIYSILTNCSFPLIITPAFAYLSYYSLFPFQSFLQGCSRSGFFRLRKDPLEMLCIEFIFLIPLHFLAVFHKKLINKYCLYCHHSLKSSPNLMVHTQAKLSAL